MNICFAVFSSMHVAFWSILLGNVTIRVCSKHRSCSEGTITSLYSMVLLLTITFAMRCPES